MTILKTALEAIEALLTDNTSEAAQAAAADARIKLANAMTVEPVLLAPSPLRGGSMKPLQNYDPNIRWSRHTFELIFMQWDYSLKIEVEVKGNCRGADLIDSAIGIAFDDLYDQDDEIAVIELRRPAEDGEGEDTLEVTLEGDDELKSLCVSARITKHKKEDRS